MEKFISGWCDINSVPESYILPPEIRPGNYVVPQCDTIPLIDLGGGLLGNCDRVKVVQQIVKASQEYGFFQTKKGSALMTRNKVADYPQALTIFRKKYTTGETTCDINAILLRNTSIFGPKSLLIIGKHNSALPRPCCNRKKVVGKYSVEVRKLSLLLLDLICEALGLECGYFSENALSQVQLMSINHYPPCPDPSLTLGLPKHSDVNLFNILLQGEVPGLQVLKDGNWLAVEPLPTAFAITIGYMLQVISNGKLKSVDHRVVTNSKVARTTVGTCIFPSSDSRIVPAKALVDNCHPPLYKSFIFKDFSDTYISDIRNGIPPTERYKLQP
ncbi:unnamed protein product [Dovyalis caffra]|uniref:Fe2OG dioxygenase domain-containing protein n=1 Tax=Dovyalis caffra TaxID=77055 RepID=A0AAV1S7X4_9ROSI|nr:unnamed protein product [Dovyalis caffra]